MDKVIQDIFDKVQTTQEKNLQELIMKEQTRQRHDLLIEKLKETGLYDIFIEDLYLHPEQAKYVVGPKNVMFPTLQKVRYTYRTANIAIEHRGRDLVVKPATLLIDIIDRVVDKCLEKKNAESCYCKEGWIVVTDGVLQCKCQKN